VKGVVVAEIDDLNASREYHDTRAGQTLASSSGRTTVSEASAEQIAASSAEHGENVESAQKWSQIRQWITSMSYGMPATWWVLPGTIRL
jgi:hypothetical protein